MTTRHTMTALAVCASALLAAPVGASAKDVNAELSALRSATASFHLLKSADDAGWNEDITGCLASPAGGMGHHYVNWGELLDGGTLDPLRPEVLVYAPDATGAKRLVAVEYLISGLDLPPTATPPEMYGQQFHFNSGFGVWALHVWVWKHNPDGIFADWNSKVSCS